MNNTTHPLLQAGTLTERQVSTFLGRTKEEPVTLMYKLNVKTFDKENLDQLVQQFFSDENTFYLTIKTSETVKEFITMNVRFIMNTKRSIKLLNKLNEQTIIYTLKRI